MSLNAATIEILLAKGLSGADILEVARASEMKADRTNAERQARHRARKHNAVTVTPAAPNEYISNPENPSEAKASPPPIEIELVEKWNAGPAANGARKAARLDASRRSLLKARLRDHTEAEVLEAVANLGASRFHCGENDRNWRANLGWMLEAKNFLKALEMGGGKPQSTTGQFDTPEARAAYLAKLERDEKPWAKTPDKPPDRPAAYAASPPRTIGQITRQITQERAA